MNEIKSSVSETKYIFDEYWKRDFDDIKFTTKTRTTDKKKIKHLVDAALFHCKTEGSELPAIWACRRLITLSKTMTDDASLIDAFFRLGRDYPSTTKHVAEFLVNNRYRLSDPKILDRVEQWIKNLISFNYDNKNDLELSWILIIAGIYSIKLEKGDFPHFSHIPNSIVFSIICLLRQHKLLGFPLGVWDWRTRFKDSGIHGPYWLPLYESVLRKWTKDKKLVGIVRSSPHFSRLLDDKISFLDDNIFKVSRIDFKRRKIKLSIPERDDASRREEDTALWFSIAPYDH